MNQQSISGTIEEEPSNLEEPPEKVVEHADKKGFPNAEEVKNVTDKIKSLEIALRFAKLSKKAKIIICAAIALVIVFAVYQVALSSPYTGKWYNAKSSDPVLEIKGNGTATFMSNPEMSVSWQELENGDIKLSLIDLSSGKSTRSSIEMSYGKTNNGIAYLDDGNSLLFRSYDDANKVKQLSEEDSKSIEDISDLDDDSSSKSSSSSSSKKYSSYSKYKSS